MKQNVKKWNSGISSSSSMSYENYIKAGLELISPKLSVRRYKLAPKDEYPFFERGRDLRIVIFWDNKPAIDNKGRKYEFVIEKQFWHASNRNKDDRHWMRQTANIHLKNFYDAVQRGKKNSNNKPIKKVNKKKNTKKRLKMGETQTLLDNFKKQ